MSEKCASCNKPVGTVFLEKIKGTYLRDKKNKKKPVCAACQKAHPIEELRAKI
jgi:ribosomal protein L34E